MSSNKKSLGSLILLLLMFAVIATFSWFFFNNQNGGLAGLKDKVTNNLTDNGAEQSDTAAHDGHGHDHGSHGNDDQAILNPEKIGTKGKIHTLNPPAIYGHRGVGNPDAPVKIQEFFSLTCNHCADFHKDAYQDMKQNLIDTGKVYFVYEEFPLNGPALYGSMIARCLPEERYEGFIDILLRSQDKWAFGGDFKAALMQNAKLAGMSEEEFDACFNNKDLQKAVATNIKEASDVWKVNSTPSFVINDGERVIHGAKSYKTFEALVNYLIDGPTDTAKEEVKSSNPLTGLMESAGDTISNTVKDVSTTATEATTGAIGGIQSTISDGAGSIVDSAKTVATDAGNVVGDTANSAIEGTKDTIVEGFQSGSNGLKNLSKDAVSIVDSVEPEQNIVVKEVSIDDVEKAKEAGDDFKNVVDDSLSIIENNFE